VHVEIKAKIPTNTPNAGIFKIESGILIFYEEKAKSKSKNLK